MRNFPKFKKGVVTAICYLYAFLFVYAAASKAFEFEAFQLQLGQSPFLSLFAGPLSYLVIIVEFAIALLLLTERYKIIALYAAFLLMVMFTAYIILILHFSSFTPCSCGGIIEQLGWTGHIIFNCAFLLLAVLGIAFERQVTPNSGIWRFIAKIILIATSGSFVMVVLFFISEQKAFHHNNFTRIFPPHPATPENQLNLEVNSYYFAGASQGNIYLGNYTMPSLVTILSADLKTKTTAVIQLNDTTLHFKGPILKVVPPYFYVLDGSTPCIFRGNISNWKAYLKWHGDIRFTASQVIDSTTIAFRTVDQPLHQNVLGTISFGKTPETLYGKDLLQMQIDGVFDTDGNLLYSNTLNRLVYIYYYRNQYVVSQGLKLQYRGNTIDTNTIAKINVVTLEKEQVRKLTGPVMKVNRTATVCNNLLFVNSALPGKFDSKKMWDQAAVIDVYDLTDHSYRFSFYVYNLGRKSVRNFMVTESNLYALIGDEIVSYQLDNFFRSTFRSNALKNTGQYQE